MVTEPIVDVPNLNPNMKSMSFSCIIGFSALVAVLWADPGHAADAPCSVCHAQQAADFSTTPHGRALGEDTCAGCHGDAQAHLAAPAKTTIQTFVTEPAQQQNAVCSGCHEDVRTPEGNPHTAAGIACSSCHSVHQKKTPVTPMAGFDDLTQGSSLCFGCHQETFTQFTFNERHRLAEGAVECTSCHDPHKPGHSLSLGGFNHSLCSKCHADVDGPFVFEHAASRVEGCGACHEPHGNPNRHMLKFQQVGSLCYSCHAEVPQFHLGFAPAGPARFDEQTVCTNCHATIHGSNLDRLFLR